MDKIRYRNLGSSALRRQRGGEPGAVLRDHCCRLGPGEAFRVANVPHISLMERPS